MPIYRRTPKRGFNNIFAKKYEIVNLGNVQKAVDDKRLNVGSIVNLESLVAAGLVRGNKDGIRVLAKGEIKVGLTFEVAGASQTAISAVEKAGGKVLLPELTNAQRVAQEKSTKTASKKAAAIPRKDDAGDQTDIHSDSKESLLESD